MDDDTLPGATGKPDWHNEGQGRWIVTLPNGHTGVVGFTASNEKWQAVVSMDGKTKASKLFNDFKRCIGWAERELYPRPTAWDRIKAV
jgi:hypothetical protein